MAFFEDILNGLAQPAARPSFGSMAVKAPTSTTGVAPSIAQPKLAQDSSGWDDMATFFAGMGEGGGALLPALGAGARAVSGEKDRRQRVNDTYDFLLRNGVAPEDAKATMASPDLLKMKLGQIFAPPAKRDIREVNGRLVEVGQNGATEIYAPPPGSEGNAPKYGLTPYFTEDGRPYVPGTDGSVRFLEFPDGAKPLAPGELATEKARGAATGKAVGEAKATLPAVVQSTAETLGLLDSLNADPYLDKMVGMVGGRTPDISEDANRVAAKMAQVSGTAFLTAFQKLRGGGQITEVEGRKATEAISRLENRRQSPLAYREAIEDLRRIARNGVIRAQVDAGQLPPEAMSQLHSFETLGAATPPSMAPQSAPPPAYREQPTPQSQNPRAPGYQRGAPQAPNTTNPRAPGYQAPARTLDAGDGFTVKVK